MHTAALRPALRRYGLFLVPLLAGLAAASLAGARAAAQGAGPVHPNAPAGEAQQAPAQQQVPAAQQPQAPAPANPAPANQPANGAANGGQEPGFAIAVNVPVVNVEAVVTDDNGNFLSTLKKENFRISEDGMPQVITNFSTGDAPMTIAILLEYDRLGYGWYLADARRWADQFLRELKPVDWVGLISFNMRTNVEVDFTHDPRQIEQGLISLGFPVWTEANVYDALAETQDRMRDVKGKKAILVLASGLDTFSKLTYDKARAKLREDETPLYIVGVAEQLALEEESHGGLGTNTLTHIEAQQQLKEFANITGGRVWFPRFDGEIPDIMREVAVSLRQQYSLGYTPTNQATDGKYRKIKVDLVDDKGGPLVMTDQKGKKIKYIVHARQGYVAPTSTIQ